MWFQIQCSCKKKLRRKKKKNIHTLPPHWSCFKGVILSRIAVCTRCRNATQHQGDMHNIKLHAAEYQCVS